MTIGQYYIKNIIMRQLDEIKYSKVDINYPYVHPRNFEEFSCLLNIRAVDLEKILATSTNNSNVYEIINNPVYLEYDDVNDEFSLTVFHTKNCINVIITGNYSLYIALNTVKENTDSVKVNSILDLLLFNVLKMPEIIQNSNDYRLQLSNYYKIIENLNDKYSTVTKEYHEKTIQDSIKNSSFDEPTMLLQQDLEATNYNTTIKHIYDAIVEILSGKDGVIRSEYLGHRIDFSARSVVTIDLSLLVHQIKIPKLSFIKLFNLEYILWARFNYRDAKHDNSYILQPSDCIYIDEFIDWFFTNSQINDRLVLFGRQPTLWRFGLMAVEVAGISDLDDDIGPVITVNPLLVDPYNMDFDGDTAYINKLHTEKAKQCMYDKMFIRSQYQYDHNDTFLYNISLEAYYCFKVLSSISSDPKNENNWLDIEVETFEEVPLSYDLINDFSKYIVVYDLQITYGLAVLHKLLHQTKLIINSDMTESDLSELIYNATQPTLNTTNNLKYHHTLQKFNQLMHNFVSCLGEFSLTLPIADTCDLLNYTKKLSTNYKLPNHAHVGVHLHNALLSKTINHLGDNTVLSVIAQTKFKKEQIKRAVVSIGFVSDSNNVIIGNPIQNNMFYGLTEDEYFQSAYGSRLGLVSKESLTPESGYLTRTMIMNNSPIEIFNDDCRTSKLFKITILDESHFTSLIDRYYSIYKTCDTEDVKLLTKYDSDYVGQTLYFRSPMTCNAPFNKICRKCFGEHKIPSKYVGVFTSHAITERLTQLSLRIFHTSGAGVVTDYPLLTTFLEKYLINVNNTNDEFILTFSKPIPSKIFTILDEMDCQILNKTDVSITISNVDQVVNNDIALRIKEIKSLLKTESKKINKGGSIAPPLYTYSKLITELLSIGQLYSTYIESMLCNLYYTKDGILYRYAINDDNIIDFELVKKYSIYNIHSVLSPIIGFLYQPNKKNFLKYFNQQHIKVKEDQRSVFEMLWIHNHI